MTEEEKVDIRGKRSWLEEHDSIQSDLLRMKDEILLEEGVKGHDRRDMVPIPEKKEMKPPTSVRKDPEHGINGPLKKDQELTIRQLLGSEQKPRKDTNKDKRETLEKKEPARLDEGVIPASPDLSSKIANVLQLENDLKRRRFELEKRAGKKSIPPPPVRPGSVIEAENDIIGSCGMKSGVRSGEMKQDLAGRDGMVEESEKGPASGRKEKLEENAHGSEDPPSNGEEPQDKTVRDEVVEKDSHDEKDKGKDHDKKGKEKEPGEKKKKRWGFFGWFSKEK